MEDIDRDGFYHPLKKCKSISQVLELIDNIDNDDLQGKIKDKYHQFIEYNKQNEFDLNALIVTLEATYLDFVKDNEK